MKLFVAGIAAGVLVQAAVGDLVPDGMTAWITIAAVALLSWSALFPEKG